MTSRTLAFSTAALVLLLCACNGSSSYSSPTAPPPTSTNPPTASYTITILGDKGPSSFSPNPASAKAGTSIQWTNGDSITHHIVSDAANVFDTGTITGAASSKTVTVNQTGSYPYHCTIHPTMVGTLNVTQ